MRRAVITAAFATLIVGGRGGRVRGPLLSAGRSQAILGRLAGTDVTPLGSAQIFAVVPISQ